MYSNDGRDSDLVFGQASNTDKVDLDLFRARGSIGAESALTDGDIIGSVRFTGYDGNSFETRASIVGKVDGTVTTAGVVPTALSFNTANTNFADGIERMIIESGGDIGINVADPNVELDVGGDIEYTGTITDVSDRRLKKNIKPFAEKGSALEMISKMDTYSFTMKDDKENKTEFGVMAQELEEIYPTLVHTADDKMGTKSVNYTGLITPLIEAVKNLKDLLDGLVDKVADLFDMVSKLQTENKMLKSEVDSLKSQNQDIIKRLEALEANDNSPLESNKVSSLSKQDF